MGDTEPRPSRVPPVVVAAGIAVTVVAGMLVSFRAGGLVLGGLLGGAAVARMLLPLHVIGLLAVRSRLVDVTTLGLLCAAVTVLALTAPPG